MYEKARSFLLRSTASALTHNLDVCRRADELKGAVIHKSSVNVITWNTSDGKQNTTQIHCKGDSGEKRNIFQAKWCNINEALVLVIIGEDGLQIYDETGEQLHLWYHFEKGSVGQCIAGLGESCLGIGNNNGTVSILRLGPKISEASLIDTLHTGWDVSIQSIASSACNIACGGRNGKLFVWQAVAPFNKVQCFDTYGSPCNGICFSKHWVIAAYGSGHLRIFDTAPGQILAEVTAHAKCISALDVSESGDTLISVSEDSFIRVWRIAEKKDYVIQQIFSNCVPNTQLCGARILDSIGKEFAVSGFESEEIILYAM